MKSPSVPSNTTDSASTREFTTVCISTLQREVWLDQALFPDLPVYNTSACVRIDGPINAALFQRALEYVVAQHDALRVVLAPGDELPEQRILHCVAPELEYVDLSMCEDAEERARHWMRQAAAKPFVLHGSLLFRFALLKLGNARYAWFTAYHHIIIDGSIASHIVEEVADAYNALLVGQSLPDQPAPSYTDFVADDDAYVTSEQFRADEIYWKSVYRTLPEPLFYRRHDVAANEVYRSHQAEILLDAALCAAIRTCANEYQATHSQVILGALYAYFTRTAHRDDLAFGLFSRNRNTPAFNRTVGLFSTTYSAWYRCGTQLTFVELLRAIGNDARRGAPHRRFPISSLVRAIGLFGTDRPRPFDVAVSFLTRRAAARFGSALAEVLTISNGFQPHGLVIYIEDTDACGRIRMLFDGNCTVFSQDELQRLVERFEILLAEVVSHPQTVISQLPMMSAAETSRILASSSGVKTSALPDRCVHEGIEERVEKSPNAIAVEFANETITYAELNIRANQWAHHLQTLGVGPEVCVGCCLERSLDMIVAMLAIWKAGGVYVPLDPELPQERLALMIAQARARVILTQSHLVARIPHDHIPPICMDRDDFPLSTWPSTKPSSAVRPDNPVYLIFTSGSSGTPKGVVVTHANLVHLTRRLVEIFAIQPDDRILQFTSSSWDTSFEEIVPCLWAGGRLVLRTRDMLDPIIFLRECSARRISILDLPTSFFNELVHVLSTKIAPFPESVHTLVIGGEAARTDRVADFIAVAPSHVRLLNTFGLTEATAISTFHELRALSRSIPIGIPLPDVDVYLLDRYNEPVPFDVLGEMFIGGAGISRGYFDRPTLTAERFVPDPFSSIPGTRMYRTGDLAERRIDGAILFYGRADQQIKIRGIRVEPGEIEMVLAKHPCVREALVELRRNSNESDCLVAYVIPQADPPPSADEIRRHAREQLPAHMIPEAVVFLDQWPRLPTGKLDRRALPEPTAVANEVQLVPRSPTEELLAHAFADVLGTDPVGRNAHFFELGGHSLLAMRLMATLRSRIGFSPPLASIFQNPTVDGLAAFIDRSHGHLDAIRPAPRSSGESPFESLSSMERRLWFLERLHPELRAYQAPHGFRIFGRLDETALHSSFHALALRHEILRTTYSKRDGEPIRRISNFVNIPVHTVDLSSVPEDQKIQTLQQLIADEIATSFDLENGPLTRILVVNFSADDHFLLLNQHHIITDEWSGGVLLREWSLLYEAAHLGREAALPPLPYQYAEFARAEHVALTSEGFSRSRAYWKQRLEDVPRLDLPWLLPAKVPGPEARASIRIAPEVAKTLRDFARTYGVTSFMVWYAAVLVLFFRHSGQMDFALGSVVANRDVEDAEKLLGFFTNRLVLRTQLDGDPTFLELVHRARTTAIDAYRHQAVPFDIVVQDQKITRSVGEMPFYDVSFFQITMPTAGVATNWLPFFDVLPAGVTTAKNALSVALVQADDTTEIHVVYDMSRVDATTVRRLLDQLQLIVTDGLQCPSRHLSKLNMLTPEERESFAAKNHMPAKFRSAQCIHELFEEQCARQPDAIAVAQGDTQITYAELNRRANGLAHHLRNLGISPEKLVGLCVERSIDMVVGLLGIMKAGGAYVPIDPSWPRERIAQIAEETAMPAILTQWQFEDRLPIESSRIVLDTVNRPVHASNLPPPNTAGQHAAYVLFTSGSTGKPKGVVVEHRQLVEYVLGIADRLGFDTKLRYGLVSTFSADLGNTALFPSLARGGTLHLVTEAQAMNPNELADEFERHPVDVLKIAPSHLAALLAVSRAERLLPRKRLVLGGDVTRWDLVDAIRLLAPSCILTNHYGPTEATIGVLTLDVNSETRREHSMGPALGKPRPNVCAYVLDANLSPVPTGVSGELYIGGLAVARGYLARPGLTADRFVPDPFLSEPGERMYRTGDLVRWNDDRNIEFIGRVDQQVKIRGFRIELGEIEAALSVHESVRACVVLAREDVPGDKRLTAYVVGDEAQGSGDVLRAHLRETLPEYMIPGVFVFLASLPLTPNGKIDRRALPTLDSTAIHSRKYTAPRNALEEAIVTIWEELLNVKPIGISDDFFSLGGHSLLALRFMALLEKRMGIAPPVATLFEHATVETFAETLERLPERTMFLSRLGLARRAQGEGPYEGLSSNERRLWFLHRLYPHARSYQVPIIFRVRGEFDITALQASIAALAARHEILRTIYPEVDGSPIRVVLPAMTIPFRFEDVSNGPHEGRTEAALHWLGTEIGTAFELENGPLLRVLAIRQAADDHYVVWHQHHIITDEWSNGILTRELMATYERLRRREPIGLPEPTYQYADVARAEHEALEREQFAASRTYWKGKLNGTPRISWPMIRPAAGGDLGAEGHAFRRLPTDVTNAFHSFARQHACTPFMGWYAIFAALLSRYAQEWDFGVGTVVANRNVPETEKIAGFFTNTIVLRTDLSGDPAVQELFARARRTALEAYRHQSMPFDIVVRDQGCSWQPAASPLFDVSIFEVSSPRVVASTSWAIVREGESDVFPEGFGAQGAKDTLAIAIEHGDEGTKLGAYFDLARVDRHAVERLLGHLCAMAEDAMRHPDKRLSDLSFLSDEEITTFRRWNNTIAAYPAHECIHSLITQQAAKTPDNYAAVFGNQTLTYRDLDARANSLAQHLRSLGVKPDVLVGLCVERSIDMVVAMLGILKAGGAYVPIDSTLPEHRLRFFLDDTRTAIVVTQQHLATRLGALNRATLELVLIDEPTTFPDAINDSSPDVTPYHLAYVIHTSGSTGEPKGVMIEHHSVVAHVSAYVQYHCLTETDRILALTPAHFDASVEQIFPALACGACVVVADWDFEPASFSEKLVDFRITLLDTSGAHWRALVDTWLERPQLAERLRLRTMIVGGDVMPAEVLSRWRKTLLSVRTRLINVYGPTETTVAATAYEVKNDFDVLQPRIPIGKPLANRQAFVLDPHLQPLPVGVPGELFLGGIGPARGYLNHDELTAERFFDLAALSFAAEWAPAAKSTRVYRTGDLCQWLPDGSLDFLGRTDNQVKVRGYRVELGEIEAHLRRLSIVKDAVVLVYQQGLHKSLVAYVVANLSAESDLERTLADSLRQTLPEHMIPSYFVAIAEIPRSPTTGKVDRGRLPEPRPKTTKTRVGSSTSTEERIAEIFKNLLKVEEIAINDDFFELGGHSLLATQLVSRLDRTFAVHLPLHIVFEHRSIETLAAYIESHQRASSLANTNHWTPIRKISRSEPSPLTFGQERLWFLDRLGNGAAFLVPLALRIEGPLDVDALVQSLSEIASRHESLRTSFILQNDEPRQIIKPPVKFDLPVIDLRGLPIAQRNAEVMRHVQEEARQPFDLAVDLPLRATLLWSADEPIPTYILLLTMHHIVSDGWSLDIFARELAILYGAYQEGLPSPLPELSIQMVDVAAWQRGILTPERLALHDAYWKKQLENVPDFLPLPTYRSRREAGKKRGVWSFHIDEDLTIALRALAQRAEATTFMVVLAAFQVLLGRWANQDDVIVGTPVAGRNREELEPIIGFFVNNLPLRTNLAHDPPFMNLLFQVRQTVQNALEHQELPFEKLVASISPERNSSRHPIFQVVLAVHETPGQPISLPGVRVTPMDSYSELARLDLEVHLDPRHGGFDGLIYYDTGLFDLAAMQALAERYHVLLQGIVTAPNTRVHALPLLTAREQQQMLVEWNDTVAKYADNQCAHERIAAQAQRTPDAIAIIFDDGNARSALSYRELMQRANRLAHYLRALGVGPEQLVGLCLDPSLERIVGLLGILVAGGAYVPLDPTYPRKRLEFMLEETGPTVVVTLAKFLETLPSCGAQLVCLDRDAEEIAAMQPSEPEPNVRPDNLAYVIYTSGSTGKPKGVLVPHRGLVNVAEAQRQLFQFGPGDRILQWAALSFDSVVAEIWMTLASGATLYLAPREEVFSGEPLLRYLKRNDISMVTLTPSALSTLPAAELPALRTLAVAGEACGPALVQPWAHNRRFLNLYGPTEATIWSTAMACVDPVDANLIGRPIQNTQVYVLDRRGNPVPPGTLGELYLGGIGVVRGYLNEPALTALRFVPNPFGLGRLYRTGDLVRVRAGGELEFVGRTDDQVKIRGFRIELGEIETAILAQPNVREAVVAVREDKPGEKRLIAYIVPVAMDDDLWGTLRTHLRATLPEFMIPSDCVILETLPRSPNGKVDRRALPQPDDSQKAAPEQDRPPRTPAEAILTQIWSEVLGRVIVSVNDRFFDLGGHSLLIARVASRIHHTLQREVPLSILFERTTIESLAEWLETRGHDSPGKNEVPVLRPVPRDGPLPLSLVQERMWVLHEGARYNIPMALSLSGRLDTRAIEKSFRELVRRHEALRTNIVTVAGQPMQIIREADFQVEIVDLRDRAKDEQLSIVQRLAMDDASRSFDLAADALFRVTLILLEGEREHALLLNMHHITSDAESIEILLREFATLYDAYRRGLPSPLSDLPLQYADFAAWQRAWLSPERQAEQIAYWRRKLEDAPASLGSLVKEPRRANLSTRGQWASITLPKTLTSQIRRLGKELDATQFVTLLAAFEVALAGLSGQSDIVVCTSATHRKHIELEGVCGCFLHIIPLRADVSKSRTFVDIVHQMRGVMVEALPYLEITSSKLDTALFPERDMKHDPLFQISFNMVPTLGLARKLLNIEVSDILVPVEEFAKYDLTLHAMEVGDEISLRALYKVELFAPETIPRLLDEMYRVLVQVVADPGQQMHAR